MPSVCEAPLALRCKHGGAVYMDAPPAYCSQAPAPTDDEPSLVDTRRDAGDEAVRARIAAALATHPTYTRAQLAAALGCSRQWLEREAAAVGVVLPAGKPGPRGPRRPSAEAPK